MGNFVNVDSISNLYNFDPAVKNLYTVEVYDGGMEEEDWEGEEESTSLSTLHYIAQLHAIQVDLPGDSLKLERNEVTKNFSLGENGGYTWNDTLTIQWRETRDWRVKKLHENWLAKFYNKATDKYISIDWSNEADARKEVEKRYKVFKITLPNESKIVCRDVIPQGVWNLSLAWGNSPSIVTYPIVYNVGFWYWE